MKNTITQNNYTENTQDKGQNYTQNATIIAGKKPNYAVKFGLGLIYILSSIISPIIIAILFSFATVIGIVLMVLLCIIVMFCCFFLNIGKAVISFSGYETKFTKKIFSNLAK